MGDHFRGCLKEEVEGNTSTIQKNNRIVCIKSKRIENLKRFLIRFLFLMVV